MIIHVNEKDWVDTDTVGLVNLMTEIVSGTTVHFHLTNYRDKVNVEGIGRCDGKIGIGTYALPATEFAELIAKATYENISFDSLNRVKEIKQAIVHDIITQITQIDKLQRRCAKAMRSTHRRN